MEREPDTSESGTPTETAYPAARAPTPKADPLPRTIHRIGGATVENLRLKPKEATLNPPGISVIKAQTPNAAAQEIRTGYPKATKLHEHAKTIGSAAIDPIQKAGFDVIPMPSEALPNHHRLIHPDGVVGFSDENLARLAEVFVNTTGN